MDEQGHGERLARLEGVFSEVMPAIKKYMEAGVTARIEGNRRLGAIETSVGNFKEYQQTCDTERADHEKRITATEGYQMRQTKAAAKIGGIVALAVTGAIEWIRK